jgi:hypothetical protein
MSDLYYSDQLRDLAERLSNCWYAMAYILRRLSLPPVDSATHGMTRAQLDAILPMFSLGYDESNLLDSLVDAFEVVKHGKTALRFGNPTNRTREFLKRRQRLLHSLGIIAVRIPELQETVAGAINAIHSVESDPDVLMSAIVLENSDDDCATPKPVGWSIFPLPSSS